MKIVFATHNNYKFEEVNNMLSNRIELLNLSSIGCFEAIPETSNTLVGNAILKANYISNTYNCNCFADDTGLEVKSLKGAPGVHSARYSGKNGNSEKNIDKLLRELSNHSDRSARFKTCIVLNFNDKQFIFEGVCEGDILLEKSGYKGFGYDPIFRPKGFDVSFSEMSMKEKGQISHRGIGIAKLIKFLNKIDF